MHLMVLDKIDSWEMHKAKVKEEALELVEAIEERDLDHIIEEALDNIQVSVGILDKAKQEGKDIKEALQTHNTKLLGRGWKSKALIKLYLYIIS